jgi:hypothetical protein
MHKPPLIHTFLTLARCKGTTDSHPLHISQMHKLPLTRLPDTSQLHKPPLDQPLAVLEMILWLLKLAELFIIV